MNDNQWRELDPENLPDNPGLYAFLWRQQWLYLGTAESLKKELKREPWPYKIAKSLDEARLLWIPTEDYHRMAMQMERVLRLQWKDAMPMEMPKRKRPPKCRLVKSKKAAPPQRMLARSLTYS
ncbi:MAG: hypothetical protein HC824_22140 [Synechococcales cyanobacterium RM1_1_8]|nr:hypothetical protein [Synechococcales cyanobacterium RM1_1_8]